MKDTAVKSRNMCYVVELRRTAFDSGNWTVCTEAGHEFLNTTDGAGSMKLYLFLEHVCRLAVGVYNLFR